MKKFTKKITFKKLTTEINNRNQQKKLTKEIAKKKSR
jgi:hypothetical protein